MRDFFIIEGVLYAHLVETSFVLPVNVYFAIIIKKSFFKQNCN